jgi:hypothetical protein
MTDNIKLPPELVDKCWDYASKMVEHYSNSGDRITAMPWTRDQLSADELRAWLASRKEAGRNIDIETCELGWWYTQDADPYGIYRALGEFNEAMYQVGRNRFVRSPDSQGWVCEDDLPIEKFCAMQERVERERQARD